MALVCLWPDRRFENQIINLALRLESLPAIYSYWLCSCMFCILSQWKTSHVVQLFHVCSCAAHSVEMWIGGAMLNPTVSNKNSIRATIFLVTHSSLCLLFASPHSPFINFDFTRWYNLIFPKATSSRDLHVMCDLAVWSWVLPSISSNLSLFQSLRRQ